MARPTVHRGKQITYTPGMPRMPAAKTQRQRFIEAARELGVDESEAAFDRTLKKIGRAPAQSPKKATRKSKK